MPSDGFWSRLLRGCKWLLSLPLILLVQFYRYCIPPFTPPTCRFTPTCSAYAYEAINKYGALKGGFLALKRILRCHPFYKGDYFDPVP